MATLETSTGSIASQLQDAGTDRSIATAANACNAPTINDSERGARGLRLRLAWPLKGG